MVTKKRRKKDEKKNDTEKEILNKLQTLEKSISELRSSLSKIDKSSFQSNEDQLFFSFVFSLALLSITIPSLDVGTLFASFGVTLKLSTPVLSMKYFVIGLLVSASALRYGVATFRGNSENKNILRTWSVRMLFFSLYFLLIELLIRGLATFLQKINVFLLPIPPMILIISSHFIGLVEKKWVNLYKHAEPTATIVTFAIGLFVLFTYILSMVLTIFVSLSLLVIFALMIGSFVLAFVITRLYVKKL